MNKFLYFILGAGVGSVCTYFGVKKYFEARADAEIEEMRLWCRDKINQQAEQTESEKTSKSPLADVIEGRKSVDEEMKEAYETVRHNYGQYFKPLNAPPTDPGEKEPDPYDDKDCNAILGVYLIAPEEFGQIDGYSECSLTYYAADKVLVDEDDDPVDNISYAIGETFIDHFGDYQPDVVHVRNENTKTDYEITRDERSYDDLYPERHIHELP